LLLPLLMVWLISDSDDVRLSASTLRSTTHSASDPHWSDWLWQNHAGNTSCREVQSRQWWDSAVVFLSL